MTKIEEDKIEINLKLFQKKKCKMLNDKLNTSFRDFKNSNKTQNILFAIDDCLGSKLILIKAIKKFLSFNKIENEDQKFLFLWMVEHDPIKNFFRSQKIAYNAKRENIATFDFWNRIEEKELFLNSINILDWNLRKLNELSNKQNKLFFEVWKQNNSILIIDKCFEKNKKNIKRIKTLIKPKIIVYLVEYKKFVNAIKYPATPINKNLNDDQEPKTNYARPLLNQSKNYRNDQIVLLTREKQAVEVTSSEILRGGQIIISNKTVLGRKIETLKIKNENQIIENINKFLVSQAIKRYKKLLKQYKSEIKSNNKNKQNSINPLIIIAIPKIINWKIQKILKIIIPFLEKKLLTNKNNELIIDPELIGKISHLKDEKIPEPDLKLKIIKNHETICILTNKQNITKWDCPRAQILVFLSEKKIGNTTQNNIVNKHLLNVSEPYLQKPYYSKNDDLNQSYYYFWNNEIEGMENEKKLTEDEIVLKKEENERNMLYILKVIFFVLIIASFLFFWLFTKQIYF